MRNDLFHLVKNILNESPKYGNLKDLKNKSLLLKLRVESINDSIFRKAGWRFILIRSNHSFLVFELIWVSSKSLKIVLIVFSTILFADEWDESYENGKAALEQGDWHVADSLFQIALSLRPEPDLQAATSALKLIEYLPHYYLGQAYFFAGRYALALRSFQKSTQAEAVNKTQHLVRLQRLMKMEGKILLPSV